MPTVVPSPRMAGVQPAIVPIVGGWIRDTPGTISLGQGMVAYGPPPAAIEAARAFGADADDHRYGAVEGDPVLVEAFARKLAAENGVRASDDTRVVVTAGSNMGFLQAVLAVTEPGDEVILQRPFYFNHEMAVLIAGSRVVAVDTTSEYQLDIDRIRQAITPRTRAVVTVSPNNPTGAVYPRADLQAINALCAARGLVHVHDEAYEYFTYDDARHVSPASFDGAAGHTISLFSMSKGYGFAGWRIGFMLLPAALFDAVNKIQDTNLICPPLVSQRAAAAALAVGGEYCREQAAALPAVRRHLFDRLAPLADICEAPRTEGAFYGLLRLRGRGDPMTVAERLVREHRVAVIPGTAFGAVAGCHLRVSYGALDATVVEEGIDRLTRGLRTIAGS